MPYKLSGTLNSYPNRLIILNESNWYIESNSTTTSGSFEISDLVSGTKTIISRDSGGKVAGAGNINGIYYALPFPQADGGLVTTSGNYRSHTFSGTGTFTVTVSGSMIVECWGAGGNGAAGDSFSRIGGGGGGGGYTRSTISTTISGYAITAGVGLNSSFGNNIVYATKGGNGTPGSSSGSYCGAGGVGHGTINYTGGGGTGLPSIYAGCSSAGPSSNGITAVSSSSTGAIAVAGGGKGGDNGFYYGVNGSSGGFPGGGGGGSGYYNKSGGIGAGGKVVITYQYQ